MRRWTLVLPGCIFFSLFKNLPGYFFLLLVFLLIYLQDYIWMLAKLLKPYLEPNLPSWDLFARWQQTIHSNLFIPSQSISSEIFQSVRVWTYSEDQSIDLEEQQDLGEYTEKKNPEKVWSFAKPPSDPPPPGLVFFGEKKLTPIFFVGQCIYNVQNEFYTWSHSKTKTKKIDTGPLFLRIL